MPATPSKPGIPVYVYNDITELPPHLQRRQLSQDEMELINVRLSLRCVG